MVIHKVGLGTNRMFDKVSERLGRLAGIRETDAGDYLYMSWSVVNCVFYGTLIFCAMFIVEAILYPYWTPVKTIGYPGLLMGMSAIPFLRVTRRPDWALVLGGLLVILSTTAIAMLSSDIFFPGMLVLVGVPCWVLLLLGRRMGLMLAACVCLCAVLMIWHGQQTDILPPDQWPMTIVGIGLAIIISTVGGLVVLHMQQEARSRLRAERNRAEAANEEKSSLIASISHDVRTPVTSLVGVLQLIEQRGADPETLDLVRTANGSARSLLGLIDDLLDLSKIDAGALKLNPKPFNLTDLFRSTIEAYRSSITAKGLDLVIRAPEQPVWISGDQLRVSQILLNYLTNAIKFTDTGTIRAALNVSEEGEGRYRIRLQIEDTGHGLSTHAQSVIFDRFVQAEHQGDRVHVGSGLGLAIVRDLAVMLNGSVGATSAEGEGSVFWFEAVFPVAQPVARLPGTGSSTISNRAGLRILLVDDNEGNQKVLSRLLGAMGHTVESAGNGQIGVERVLSDPSMDLILMDMRMPVMNGEQAIREIRASNAPARHLPIIALSADDEEVDRLRSLGANDFLRKPIDLPELSRAIGNALSDADQLAGS
jgi:signal transduction histidine kinase/CheY-like chemotaxis protein